MSGTNLTEDDEFHLPNSLIDLMLVVGLDDDSGLIQSNKKVI